MTTILKHFLFFSSPIQKEREELYSAFSVCLSSNVKDETALFNDLQEKLRFPSYFGFNWDALWDCITDLRWIEEKKIVIIYDDIPKLEASILKTYLQLLIEATFDWENSPEHSLEIVFPEKCREKILEITKDLIIENI